MFILMTMGEASPNQEGGQIGKKIAKKGSLFFLYDKNSKKGSIFVIKIFLRRDSGDFCQKIGGP